MEKAIETTIAQELVDRWMQENKLYLLDGDMRILHPIARAALIEKIARELKGVEERQNQVEEYHATEIQPHGKVKARKKGKD